MGPRVPIRASHWLALALVLVGTVVLYLPALHTAFFADDYLFLDQVRGRSLWGALIAPDPLSNFFRPVSRQLYFWIIAGLTHESPYAFRVGNLVTLLGVVALLWALVRRLAGARAAIFAAAFVALHYAADVPVRWACGSQELLSVLGALAALLLHISNRRRWAGVAMLFAVLSKEVVLFTPLIAIVADRRAREPLLVAVKRAWPMAVAILVWGLCFLAMPGRRVAQGAQVEFDLVNNPLASLVHLVQVIPGAEWVAYRFAQWPLGWMALLPVVASLVALLITWNRPPDPALPEPESQDARRANMTALVWITLAVIPIMAVTSLWSAYYYLFAICGVALLLGLFVARAPVALAAILFAVLACGSANGRNQPDFGMGRNPWTTASHINAAYLERSNRVTAGYLGSLRRAHPGLPSGSTLYFGGLAGNVAFQRGDGPLIRWAYRDTSLRAYYMYALSKQTIRPGPMMFFLASADTLMELEPGSDQLLRVAFGLIPSDHIDAAQDAFGLAQERHPWTPRLSYWRAWTLMALGDTAGAHVELGRAGYAPTPGPAEGREGVLDRLAAGDTLSARSLAMRAMQKHPLDAAGHGLAADLMLISDRHDPDGAIEAFAARVLAPADPNVWYRWAMVQAERDRPLEAYQSLRIYLRLGGTAAQNDVQARELAESIRSAIPSGTLDPEQIPE
ncbi:MAG: hypothetical protein ABIU54_04715 [Candidatus Eisenbacteria bacterium]